MNPYQRIIRNSKIIQEGHIDTQEKFKQLFDGVDIKGKTIVDIGCNLGEMCRIAKDNGAIPVGFDIEREYILQARQLNNDIEFAVSKAENIKGEYDIAICSAMFHYIKDHDKFFDRLSKISNFVTMDVWIDSSDEAKFVLTNRGLFIPTKSAFLSIVSKYFNKITEKNQAISPDGSYRVIYNLEEPKREKPNAIIIYGKGGTGKTTIARDMIDYEHLQLDEIFVEWKVIKQSIQLSVEYFYQLVRGEIYNEYIEYHKNYIKKWLEHRFGCGVVIEGFDMLDENYRNMVKNLLKEKWNIKEISL